MRPYAQQALFRDVKIDVGEGASNNLDKLLECYTKSPYAMHARALKIVAGSLFYLMQRHTDFERLIKLLSTCKQSIDPWTHLPHLPLQYHRSHSLA